MSYKFRARVKLLKCGKKQTAMFYYSDTIKLPFYEQEEKRGIAWNEGEIISLKEDEVFAFEYSEKYCVFSFLSEHSNEDLIIEIKVDDKSKTQKKYNIIGATLSYE